MCTASAHDRAAAPNHHNAPSAPTTTAGKQYSIPWHPTPRPASPRWPTDLKLRPHQRPDAAADPPRPTPRMTGPLLPAEASSMAYPTTEATPFGLAHRRSIANEAARECYCPIGVSDPILWPRTARQEPGVLVPGLTGGRSSPDRSRHRAGSDPVRGRCLSVQRLDPPVEAWVSAQGPLRPAQPVARLGIEVGERHRQRCGHAAVCCEPVGRVLAASADPGVGQRC
jgi:hypothetical protein